jgi:hypothetical protein
MTKYTAADLRTLGHRIVDIPKGTFWIVPPAFGLFGEVLRLDTDTGNWVRAFAVFSVSEAEAALGLVAAA